MRQYALRRLAYLPLIAAAVSLLTFFTLRSPWAGDPVLIMAGENARPEQVQALREDLGLDKPVLAQYGEWLGATLTGDFGKTFQGRQPVYDEVVRRLPITFEIMFFAVFFSTVMGVAFGVVSAVKRNTPLDYGVRVLAVFGQSVPTFFLLVLLIVLPSLWWSYSAPVGGHISLFTEPGENLRLYLPPTFLLALAGAAGLMRLTRSTMLEVLGHDYIRTARAKGVPGGALVLRHALGNAALPIVTVIGSHVTALFFGALILEQTFSINGLGQFFFNSVQARDFPVVQFLVLYTAFVAITLNLLVDLSYAFLDPRIRYS